jgi:hypothetical protein
MFAVYVNRRVRGGGPSNCVPEHKAALFALSQKYSRVEALWFNVWVCVELCMRFGNDILGGEYKSRRGFSTGGY